MSVQHFTRNVYLLPFSDMFFSAPLRSRDLARALNALPAALGETQLRKWRARGGGLPGILALHWAGGVRLKVRFQSLLRAREARAPRCMEDRFPAHRCPLAEDLLEKRPGWELDGGSPREPLHQHGSAVAVAKRLGTCPRFLRGCAGRKMSPFPRSLRPAPASPLPAPVAEQPRSRPARPDPYGAPAPFCPTCPAVSRGAEKEGFPRLRNAPAGSVLSAVRGASGANL